MNLKKFIRSIPGYPKKGILFRDITTLIKDEKAFEETINQIIEWGKIENCDLFINSTSVGLNKDDNLRLDLNNVGKNKIFYDVIYNPSKTNFLSLAEKKGHRIINGKDMFLYQAQKAFELWNNLKPEINEQVLNLLDD